MSITDTMTATKEAEWTDEIWRHHKRVTLEVVRWRLVDGAELDTYTYIAEDGSRTLESTINGIPVTAAVALARMGILTADLKRVRPTEGASA